MYVGSRTRRGGDSPEAKSAVCALLLGPAGRVLPRLPTQPMSTFASLLILSDLSHPGRVVATPRSISSSLQLSDLFWELRREICVFAQSASEVVVHRSFLAHPRWRDRPEDAASGFSTFHLPCRSRALEVEADSSLVALPNNDWSDLCHRFVGHRLRSHTGLRKWA